MDVDLVGCHAPVVSVSECKENVDVRLVEVLGELTHEPMGGSCFFRYAN